MTDSGWAKFWKHTTSSDKIAVGSLVVNVALVAVTVGLVCVTQELVHDADRNAQKQLRAYIAAKEPTIAELDSGVPKIGVTLTNTGQTPAKNVRATLAIDIREYPLRAEIPQEAYILDSVLLGKDLSLDKIETKGFAPLAVANIKEAGTQRLYVKGHVCYVDVFEKPKHLSFCFMYMGNRRPGFALCEGTWNYEDEKNCPEIGTGKGTLDPASAASPSVIIPIPPTRIISPSVGTTQ